MPVNNSSTAYPQADHRDMRAGKALQQPSPLESSSYQNIPTASFSFTQPSLQPSPQNKPVQSSTFYPRNLSHSTHADLSHLPNEHNPVSMDQLQNVLDALHTIETEHKTLLHDHKALQQDFGRLKNAHACLGVDVHTLKKGGWPVHVGPFQDMAEGATTKIEERASAMTTETKVKSDTVSGTADAVAISKKTKIKDGHQAPASPNNTAAPAASTPISVPPHLRNAQKSQYSVAGKHVPHHLLTKQPPGNVPTALQPRVEELRDTHVQPNLQSTAPLAASGPRESLIPVDTVAGLGRTTQRAAELFGANDAVVVALNGTQTGKSTKRVIDGKVDVPVAARAIGKNGLQDHRASDQPPTSSSVSTNTAANIPRLSIEDPYHIRSAQKWIPLAVRQMAPISRCIALSIPTAHETVTFSYDFLKNLFGGIEWSPGLLYIPPRESGTGNVYFGGIHSYYVLDARLEPYLPSAPGQHGAKLTAFFNEHPEETYGSEAGASFEEVPMFVCASGFKNAPKEQRRYVYFGNYSQTRWSDKLDHDRMVEDVPDSVKHHCAKELSALGRPEWVTKQLREHFFPRPTYAGKLPAPVATGSVAGEDKELERDIEKYAEELRGWEQDINHHVKMIKPDFILEAFKRADADDPPSLRLWWEYLECKSYNKELYEALVGMQGRNANYLV